MSDVVILMPYTDQVYAEQCLATMHKVVRHNTVPIDNAHGENRGAAASYNIGARLVTNPKTAHRWLVTLSPSTRFGPSGGLDMFSYLESAASDEAWVVEAEMPVGWHFIAWHRRVFETIGYWDENFWPVYGEDADISYRILTHLDTLTPKATPFWRIFECDAWLTMQGYSAHVGGVNVNNQEPFWDYYVKKWGGRSGHETFKHPFNDETKPLSFWKPGVVKYE